MGEFLEKVKLITFDVFGTLVDWKSYVEGYIPGRFQEFEELSKKLQQTPSPLLPYTALLKRAILELSPETSVRTAEYFANFFGQCSPFPDSWALRSLSKSAMLGCLSNCDYRHQVDVQKRLGLNWDICMLAEDLRVYKPHQQFFLSSKKQIFDILSIKGDEWLHVSAYTSYDLEIAKDLGIKTCFIPRPEAPLESRAAELLPVDLLATDLEHLTYQIQLAKGFPVRYQVIAATKGPETAAEFLSWMTREHGHDLLKIHGCQEFRVIKLDSLRMSCEYLFTSQKALDKYIENFAPKLREKGEQLFPESRVKFTRNQAELLALGEQRKNSNY